MNKRAISSFLGITENMFSECDRDNNQTLGSIKKNCTQVLWRETSAEFVNGPNRLKRFKMTAISNTFLKTICIEMIIMFEKHNYRKLVKTEKFDIFSFLYTNSKKSQPIKELYDAFLWNKSTQPKYQNYLSDSQACFCKII